MKDYKKLDVPRYRQPKDECEPTCLKMVLESLDKKRKFDLKKIIKDTESELKYMDWDYKIGTAALKRGFKAKIITFSNDLFDPTWAKLSKKKIIEKLKKRLKFVLKYDKRDINEGYIWWWYESSLKAAIDFLEKGGEVKLKPISKELIKNYIKKNIPVITPLNGSVFYNHKRVYRGRYNDIKGEYFGHCVVISGFKNNKFIITDPEKISNKTKGIIEIDSNTLTNAIIGHTCQIIAIERR